MSTSNVSARWLSGNLSRFQRHRRFFPTERQRELFRALADAVPDNPAPEAGGLSFCDTLTSGISPGIGIRP